MTGEKEMVASGLEVTADAIPKNPFAKWKRTHRRKIRRSVAGSTKASNREMPQHITPNPMRKIPKAIIFQTRTEVSRLLTGSRGQLN